MTHSGLTVTALRRRVSLSQVLNYLRHDIRQMRHEEGWEVSPIRLVPTQGKPKHSSGSDEEGLGQTQGRQGPHDATSKRQKPRNFWPQAVYMDARRGSNPYPCLAR